ncbi:hypothetical protein Tco_0216696 [Tanacetum coccineum]
MGYEIEGEFDSIRIGFKSFPGGPRKEFIERQTFPKQNINFRVKFNLPSFLWNCLGRMSSPANSLEKNHLIEETIEMSRFTRILTNQISIKRINSRWNLKGMPSTPHH